MLGHCPFGVPFKPQKQGTLKKTDPCVHLKVGSCFESVPLVVFWRETTES